jgi:hypothetical protein
MQHKGYDADTRVREVLRAAGRTAVIPAKSNRKNPEAYAYDKELYKKRHRILRTHSGPGLLR